MCPPLIENTSVEFLLSHDIDDKATAVTFIVDGQWFFPYNWSLLFPFLFYRNLLPFFLSEPDKLYWQQSLSGDLSIKEAYNFKAPSFELLRTKFFGVVIYLRLNLWCFGSLFKGKLQRMTNTGVYILFQFPCARFAGVTRNRPIKSSLNSLLRRKSRAGFIISLTSAFLPRLWRIGGFGAPLDQSDSL